MTRDAVERDRDMAGRPRNARPRDGLGRPLERGAAGEPAMPDDPHLPPGEAVLTAQRLIDAGRPFHAHEVLETAWKTAPPGQRDLWKGLAQIAVGLTHARRGNSRGAVALLRRGADAIGGHIAARAGPDAALPGNLDLPGTRRAALLLADRIDRLGLHALDEGEIRVPLTGR